MECIDLINTFVPCAVAQGWDPGLAQLVSLLLGVSWGRWSLTMRPFATALAGFFVILAILPGTLTTGVRLFLVGCAILIGAFCAIAGRAIIVEAAAPAPIVRNCRRVCLLLLISITLHLMV